ncbi:MAG: two-component system, OmpR family, response regulator [Chloroflexota bacterium]|jgi:two-component system OmpR family response regulator|nr:two-component system, OmpR family, response regulator [Chloroflexota bacterium]
MRVLVVEDDQRLADALVRGLSESGFVVIHVTSGDDAIATAWSGGFDAIVLDVMLPGGVSGFDVASALRARKVATPILMLTGRDAVEDRIRGLEAGADDYLLKPFAFGELVARLRALARRHLPERGAVLRAGRVSLDTSARTVAVGDQQVQMTAKELSVLECFLLNPGHVLSRTQILEHAWREGEDAGDSNIVDQFVGRVRRKLMSAGTADPITTVRGLGYRFDSPNP